MIEKISQIGIVVPDMEKTIKFFEEVMGLGPFNVLPREAETCELHGKQTSFQLKTGFAFLSGIQLELIQVINGKSAHSEFLEKNPNGGIHHIAIYVEDLESEVQKYSIAGVELIARGEYMRTKWAYLDSTKQSGLLLELIELPKRKKKKKDN
ncbi:MAG: VOC family protein [Candidatus Lokiarchaeota archaeon]|nr:VOC family protein [Candidatus Lokiarchaeota archaeon]